MHEWEEFCNLVCLRFGKLQFQVLIRRLTHIRQTGTVQEYIESFNSLMHQMLAHNPNIDTEIFITTFIDGLKPEIRRVVIIQQPVDLDTAGSLALLQEEVMEDIPSRNYKRNDHYSTQRGFSQQHSTTRATDNVTEVQKIGHSASSNGNFSSKLNTLKAYRRARGLCFTCGEKWGQQHKCSPQVQICVVQELLDMLGCESEENYSEEQEMEEQPDQELH